MLDNNFLGKTPQIKITDVGPNIQPYLLKEILSKITGRDIIFVAKDRTEGQKIINTLQFLIGREVLFLPEWDTAPYENISPAQGLLHQRMRALFQIINSSEQRIVVTTIRAALQRLPAKAILKSKSLALQVGGMISRDKLLKSLIELGYTRVSCVITPGEFAIRGSIVDIAAAEIGYGYRIDFFGDRVESIKIFDIASQLTSESRTLINIFPPSELIISPDTISNFENYLLSIVGAGYKENQMFASLQDQIKPVGIENFLPAFYSKLNDIFEYLKDPVIILDNFIKLEADKFLDKAQGIYANKADEYKKTKCELLAPDKIWLSKKDLKDTLETSCVIEFSPFKDTSGNYIKAEIEAIPAFHERSGSFELLKNFIDEQISLSRQVIVSCLSEGSRERIIKILNDHEIETIKATPHMLPSPLLSSSCLTRGSPKAPGDPRIKSEDDMGGVTSQAYVIVSPIEHGAASRGYAIITEEDLFGEKIKAVKTKKKVSGSSLEQSFQIDDLVVHKEYGVGRFEGLVLVKLSNSQHDCLKILYSGNDRLFVPVENMDVIVRYGSSNENIALDSLERTSWQLKKAKAKNRIREIAVYLLEIAARRNLEQADKVTFAEGAYEEFCSGFPYVETEDQEATIAAVLEDLASGKPMDRLICGDTGVGKTEVAIRAAFVVAQSQSQALEKKLVTLICPTTLLCRQHYKVFKARFKNLNVNIVQLSRLVSPTEKQKVIQEINSGKVNIVIGTHALLTDKIDYKNLALLIVDEEHHFGVSHKEKLKRLKENIHVLTLSATPIPRTLQMSLAGIRELNLISTPPINRIATKISVSSFDPVMIKEALVREKTRSGQSFYICPRISDLSHVEETLKALLPGFKLVKAHGRLPVSELDKIMEEFYEGKFDILLSTSIIESGLDVPKANTIIIHNSDRFGLAQLYQIKGRVGRSNLDSYAYFTVQDNKLLTQETLKKLQVLQNLDELGAGFAVSSYDMDIRGFGNLLGEEQSGHIKEIGVELYQQMLEETLAELKRKDSQTPIKESWTPQINIDLPILIPEAYIPEFNLRLSLYKRASSLTNETELTAFAAELIDRFGPIPTELESLLSIIRLKQLCLEAFVTKINLGDKGILIEFVENKDPKLAEKLFEFVMKNKDKVKIKTSNSIVLIAEIKEPAERLQLAKKFLETIVV